MRRSSGKKPTVLARLPRYWGTVSFCVVLLASSSFLLHAQEAGQPDAQSAPASLTAQLKQLTDAMARTQQQLEQSQRELDELRRQAASLQLQISRTQEGSTDVSAPVTSTSAAQSQQAGGTELQQVREQQAMDEAEIATHEQIKVESASKYPVRITGLILMNGFVNTRGVNFSATPTIAVPGSGSTGASIRQTVLGFDADGPHLFGAKSSADLRVDFAGATQSSSSMTTYTYGASAGLIRLRTAHARLDWVHTRVDLALDRPILSPESPTSLAAVAEPALAWSGNLWTWNPQVGLTQEVRLGSSHSLQLQAALIDVLDAPLTPPNIASSSSSSIASSAQLSRWPGVEGRVALLGASSNKELSRLGVGGYFAPHLSPFGGRFDAWAITLDTHYRLPARLEFSGSFYRGLALGGLGAGAYKDIAYRQGPNSSSYYMRPLDDVGGWAQMKEKLSERLELNAAVGMDQVFAHQFRPYAVSGGSVLQNLARNLTYSGNIIYSPTSYLLFSLEYRHLRSSPVLGQSSWSNIIGLAAGYKF